MSGVSRPRSPCAPNAPKPTPIKAATEPMSMKVLSIASDCNRPGRSATPRKAEPASPKLADYHPSEGGETNSSPVSSIAMSNVASVAIVTYTRPMIDKHEIDELLPLPPATFHILLAVAGED